MQGPHYEHLTNAYVEALGLTAFLYEWPEPLYIDVPIAPGMKILGVPVRGYDWAVVYNHGLYIRARDGLSWDRKP